ncbi:protein tyrosine phosphatase domain-containing protein 1 isoform X1 [Tribolium castaneum]|uniref:Protein tyrosine phosphatase domain-containing protein 1 n=3 Tax=Tribolium castaneum TaxID=7070 RepID=A0A139WNW9_TRICA|nr:PREDICTED: protein tyrosine phosphatase domain-containing protein 1 isoform X1 [Tribolium castaneum]KYB29622.1 Protein tyrosine phosphatase domain-containing protein 1-like Protein [Tribolium castaneum]|eukprot:XP_968287.2 PREDICTED: protein tyrosine phosphatase domain-containing protein 1 isoform X1 [Tribolium castaneum]
MELYEVKSATNETVQANYSKLSDHIRRLTPQGIQCSVFCGGTNCKYENPENWKADSLAIQGIYSHWITDDILAMARPSTMVIVQKNIIQQFESLGIKSIINLQSPREHASCGQPLEESGFSYDPNIFMEHNIFYYNFAWKDYGDATLVGLLNMVKVLAFAVTEGRVAIHCHAGLGRTGVLIACYLVYSLRVSANDAIRYVRLKRPGSVQTRGQILCVRHFAQFVLPRTITYCLKENINKNKYMSEFSLVRFLHRQRVILHGYEERTFKFIPKIVHCICERILKLCGCWIDEFSSNTPLTFDFLYTKLNGNIKRYESTYSLCSTNSDSLFSNELKSPEEISSPSSPNPSENGDPSDSFSELSTLDGDEIREELLIENRCFQELETQKCFNQEMSEESIVIQDINVAVDALLLDYSTLSNEIKKKVRQFQIEINSSQVGWAKLAIETDLRILAMLLFEWIESLKHPVMKREFFENIVVNYKQPEVCFQKFPAEEGYFMEYLLRFVSKINPISKENQEDLIKRIIAACSQQTLLIQGKMKPIDKGFKKLRDGTLACTIEFFQSLFELIEVHHSLKSSVYLEESKMYNENDLENDFQ